MRFRKDLGDLSELKKSISEVGLIQPVVVSTTGELIAGERRLKACEELGIEPIYRVVDFTNPERAQIEENTIRKDFTAEEIYEIGKYYNEKLSKQGERTDKQLCSESERSSKKPIETVAAAVGKSTNTISQINTIFESDNTEIKDKVNKGKVTINKAYKQVKKEQKKKEQSREGSKIEISNDGIDIRHGNFVDVLDNIPNNTIDLILTDPPYPHEFIECWSDLSLFAGKKLKINGFCIAYSGQTNLVEVINRMSENLFYYWTFALIHSGNKQLINHRNIFCGWKPLLVFQNGKKKLDTTCEDIIIGSGIEKSFHKWQQAEAELIPLIEHFTKPGDIICDPFLGGGTTAVVSYELKRKFIGAEIDEVQFNIAKKRIYEHNKR